MESKAAVSLKTAQTAKTITLCAMFAALSGIGAFIRIPIPLVPMTLQLLMVLLSGLLLGARRGAISQGIYMLVGLVGFPVFTKGGGIGYILEPTFGYIIGYILAAYIAGALAQRLGPNPKVSSLFFVSLIAVLADYLVGVIYLYGILNLYLKTPIGLLGAVWTGAAVFLPKELLVCFITALLANRIIPVIRRFVLD